MIMKNDANCITVMQDAVREVQDRIYTASIDAAQAKIINDLLLAIDLDLGTLVSMKYLERKTLVCENGSKYTVPALPCYSADTLDDLGALRRTYMEQYNA